MNFKVAGKRRRVSSFAAWAFGISALLALGCAGASSSSTGGEVGEVRGETQTGGGAERMVAARATGELLTGEVAKGDWTTDAPGVRRKLTTADLPAPYATKSVDNGPRVVGRPAGALPQVPAGFRAELFASDVSNPRMIRTAPNGDLFVAESSSNRVRLLRDANGDGKPEVSQVFAEGLNQPFGIAFHPVGDNPKYV